MTKATTEQLNEQRSEPQGTPPTGGRWSWDGAQWVRLSEQDTPTPSEE